MSFSEHFQCVFRFFNISCMKVFFISCPQRLLIFVLVGLLVCWVVLSVLFSSVCFVWLFCSFDCVCFLLLFLCFIHFSFCSPDGQVQKALSVASREEAPFGSLALCCQGFGEARATRILDDYLSMGDVDFARYEYTVGGPI